jgi:ABC transporter substrate binding protein
MMAYGPSCGLEGKDGARYVDKILKEAKPADIPVEQPMKFELVINLQTAQKLGLTIPQSVLFQADKIIKRERAEVRRQRSATVLLKHRRRSSCLISAGGVVNTHGSKRGGAVALHTMSKGKAGGV